MWALIVALTLVLGDGDARELHPGRDALAEQLAPVEGLLGILRSAGRLLQRREAQVGQIVQGMGTAGEGSPAFDASKDANRFDSARAGEAALRHLWVVGARRFSTLCGSALDPRERERERERER
jgi:hypothetical protein